VARDVDGQAVGRRAVKEHDAGDLEQGGGGTRDDLMRGTQPGSLVLTQPGQRATACPMVKPCRPPCSSALMHNSQVHSSPASAQQRTRLMEYRWLTPWSSRPTAWNAASGSSGVPSCSHSRSSGTRSSTQRTAAVSTACGTRRAAATSSTVRAEAAERAPATAPAREARTDGSSWKVAPWLISTWREGG
jgi:hypothetical protein